MLFECAVAAKPHPGPSYGPSAAFEHRSRNPAPKSLESHWWLTKTSSRVPYDVPLRFVRLAKFGRGGALGVFATEENGAPGGTKFGVGAERD